MLRLPEERSRFWKAPGQGPMGAEHRAVGRSQPGAPSNLFIFELLPPQRPH